MTLKAGHRLSGDEVVSHCNAMLPRYKLPKRVVFLDEMPLNATGNMQKNVLRQQFAEGRYDIAATG